MKSKVLDVIEEQMAVGFTGKINILASFNRQFFGHILFKDGDVIQVKFQHHQGLKAFYQLIIQEYSLQSFDYVIEPELVDENERKIHYPYAVIRNRLAGVVKLYQESLRLRPPENVRIIINSEFMSYGDEVSPNEFDVLETLTEWNSPFDIYQNCNLLDHEITLALVSLRKKGALKIVASRDS